MSLIKNKSENTARVLSEVNIKIDPLTLAAIIMAVLKLFQGCNLNPTAMKKRMVEGRFLDRYKLRQVIKKHKVNHEAVEAALLDLAQDITVPEIRTMVAEL